jgi:myo-inositol-1(or 4)-monophosphatase
MPIIRSAGGIVTTWKNDDAKKGGNIICSANKSLHKKMLKILKPVSK